MDITKNKYLLAIINFVFLNLGWPFFPNIQFVINRLILVLMFFVVILYIMDKRFSSVVILISLVSILISFFTLLNEQVFIPRLFPPIGFAILTDMGLRKNPDILIKSWVILAYILIPINLISVFIYPTGIPDYIHGFGEMGHSVTWILGFYGDNGLILLCMAALLYSTVKYKKLTISGYLILAATVATGFLAGTEAIRGASATTRISVVLVIIYMIFIYNRKCLRIFNFATYMTGVFIFNIVTIFFRIHENFAWVIEELLGRELHLTHRTFLWDFSLSHIRANPLVGTGVQRNSLLALPGLGEEGIVDPHNLFLTVFLWGGVFAFIALIAVIILVGRPLMRHKFHPIAQMLSFFILISFVLAFAWAFNILIYLVPLFIMAYRVEIIIGLANSKYCNQINQRSRNDCKQFNIHEDTHGLDKAYAQPEKNSYSTSVIPNN